MVTSRLEAYIPGRARGRSLQPLRERQFRLLWFARTGSSVGDSLIPVALIWAVSHDLSGGATEVGLVLACYTFGGAAVTLAGGVWADRVRGRS